METLYQNKQAFLSEKPKKLFLISIIIVIILLLLLIISLKVEVYEHYLTKGYVDCSDTCKIIVTVPTNITIQKIKFKNKYIEPNILSKTIEIDEKSITSYYLYSLANDYGFQDKEIIDFNFCYNKQRILKKFINFSLKEGM